MDIQDLVTYWRVIRKRLWLIGLLVSVTVGTILIVSYTAKPVYKATVLFQVTAPPPAEVTLFTEFRYPSSREEIGYATNNFIEVVQSESVAWQAIEALNLDTDAEELLERVSIERVQNSDLIKLSVTADSSRLAANLANTLMQTALEYYGELRAQSFRGSREFISQQLAEVSAELNEARNALIQFQMENKVGSLDALIDSQQDLIRQLSFERDQALAEGNSALASNYDRILIERQQELQDLLELSSQYAALRAAVDQASNTYFYLLDRETEAKLKENELSNVDFIRVIPAHERSRPLPRVNFKIILLGTVVSLALGIMLAFLLEYLEGAKVTSEECKRRRDTGSEPVTVTVEGAKSEA